MPQPAPANRNKIQQLFFRPGIWMVLIGFLLVQDAYAATARYRAMWRDDPSTTMVIGWDQIAGSSAQIFFDQQDHGTNLAAYAYRQRAEVTTQARGMYNHFARLYNLLPATVYYFVLVDSDGPSRRMSFRTAPADPRERLSIISGGDSRNHRDARRNANLLVSKLRPTAIMFDGDMTAEGTPTEWTEWFDDWQLTIGSDGRLFPLIVARGNHEAENQILVDLFDVPHPEVYYAMTLGGNLLRVYTLNSLIPEGGRQRDWLEADLNRSQNVVWRFAQYHCPIRPHTASKPERDELLINWATLFQKYQVHVAIECDAHVVKTTWPIRPSREPGSAQGFIRDDDRGTVYLGEGGWGAPLRANNDDKVWTRNSGTFNQFNWIFVDQYKIEARTIKTDGAATVGEVSPYNIFEPPFGLTVWTPSNGGVIVIPNRSYTPPTAAATQAPPVQAYTPTTVITAANDFGAQTSPPPSAPAGKTMVLERLQTDARGNIKVPYQLRNTADVDLILVDKDMRERARLSYSGQTPGDYHKSVDLSKAPRGEYIMLVKADGRLIARFQVER